MHHCLYLMFVYVNVCVCLLMHPQHTSDHDQDVVLDQGLQYSLVLQHAIGTPSQFTMRGVVHLRSLKSSSSVTFHQEHLTVEELGLLKVYVCK